MTPWERKALSIALAVDAVATSAFVVLYAVRTIESPVPALLAIAVAAVVVPAAIIQARRGR